MNPWLVAAYLLVTLLLFALLLFVPAGTIAWWRGWQLLLIFFVVMTAAALWLWQVNPEISPQGVASTKEPNAGTSSCSAFCCR